MFGEKKLFQNFYLQILMWYIVINQFVINIKASNISHPHLIKKNYQINFILIFQLSSFFTRKP